MHLQYVLSPINTSSSLPILGLQFFAKFEGKTAKLISFPNLLTVSQALDPGDQKLLAWFHFALRQQLIQEQANHTLVLEGELGASLLPVLITSGRCHFVSTQNLPLSLSEARPARLEWQAVEEGLKKLKCQLSGQPGIIFKFKPFWYLDQRSAEVGLADIQLEPDVVNRLLAMPPMTDQQIKALHEALGKPVSRKETKVAKNLSTDVTPHIHLCMLPVYLPHPYVVEEKMRVKIPALELVVADESAVAFLKAQGLIHIENAALELAEPEGVRDYFILPLEGSEAWLDFNLTKLPLFKAKNFKISTSVDYPYRVVEQEDIEWYAQLEEVGAQKWFDVELGISIHGEKINLLPLIVAAIEKFFATQGGESKALLEESHLLTKLPDGRLLPIPVARLKPILNVLTELFDRQYLNAQGKIRLSKVRAAQLLALEQSIQSQLSLRWWGSKKLEALANKLKNFREIEPAPLPKGLQMALRPYQKMGLDWLQFLREYQLAGILADDMGLGKTIQTLAHILVEKEAGRLKAPCLVVTPTTLVTNWFLEAQKFCPDLRVLVLHGNTRQEWFEKIKDYDLVLTTYPLIVRDHEVLEKKAFYLLVLDEAQLIKNSRSKAALLINKIDAEYRLCLTGTPLENHLGELWSLFNFLMPGFLGNSRYFAQFFRTPIEKQNDKERRQSLSERIAPFVLRRTKESVALELPAKNEILQTIELETLQRDLYESVRLSLHEGIQQAIEKKGLAHSQMIILDALLKLRQICCDPRLLKLDSAIKSEARSAKLEYLCEILPNLISEGRQILLFSQFTEMLGLIEKEVQQLNIPYVKLTGQTQDRLTPINVFQNKEVPLFLISLKAGGLGLNLTAADTVIHYDPWWNPAVERQATDRAHRLGQDKSVFVYKLIMAGTIEEKILELQQRKKDLLDVLQVDQESESKKVALSDLQLILEYI